jgi:hypothetical protein
MAARMRILAVSALLVVASIAATALPAAAGRTWP